MTIAGRSLELLAVDDDGMVRSPYSRHDGSEEGKDTSFLFVSSFVGVTMIDEIFAYVIAPCCRRGRFADIVAAVFVACIAAVLQSRCF
mmetsp:Transcript_26811/g.34356  ORF Transcript_26811/g.34356 Transcript_26811/m.34356 type:complete len:88 (-) Transcript_26811:107-370(-)